MDNLLKPDTGLMFWTVVTFLLLVLVLTKTAWRPILEGLEKREKKIKSDLERAEQANRDAEALRQRYESQLADAQKNIQDLISRAKADGETAAARIVESAKEESSKIIARGRQELTLETERLKGELQSEVAGLSLAISERVLRKAVDEKMAREVVAESLQELAGGSR
jgi:F-type H+-transporting ATPase subunit b